MMLRLLVTPSVIPSGYVLGGDESGDQIHDIVRPAGSGACGEIDSEAGSALSHGLALAFFLVSFFFVYRSFYGMRIVRKGATTAEARAQRIEP